MDNTIGMTILLIAVAVIYVILIISEWKILEKAGEKGWKALIPFYNLFLSHHIVGMAHIWFILEVIFWIAELVVELVPAVPETVNLTLELVTGLFTIISEVIHVNRLCNCFGKKTAFKIGMCFFPEIFTPIIAFGKAEYTPPKH